MIQISHKYRGCTIKPASNLVTDGQGRTYRWYIASTHRPTGLPYDEGYCYHCYTLGDARTHIDDARALAAAAEEVTP